MAPYAGFLDDVHVVTRPALEDLRGFAGGPGGQRLLIFDYPWESFEPLAVLPELEILKVQSNAKLKNLAGLSSLPRLRVLVISPPPSWDGSGRCLEVDSYRPLSALTGLEKLTLLSVRPGDLDLAPIAAMRRHLKDLHLAGVPEFTLEHYAKLSVALPTTEGRCLQPYSRIEGVGFCKRCKGRMVLLTGAPPKKRHWLCPKCNEKKLAEHVGQWEEYKSSAA
jgi:hypothetical protein